jgi:hypothetical protein
MEQHNSVHEPNVVTQYCCSTQLDTDRLSTHEYTSSTIYISTQYDDMLQVEHAAGINRQILFTLILRSIVTSTVRICTR